MNKRNKFLKFFSAFFAASLVSVPLASCFSDNSNSGPSLGDDGDWNIGDGSSNIIKKSYVEPEIKNSINASDELKVISVNKESDQEVYRSINEFLINSFDKEEFYSKLSKEMLLKDVYSFLYKTYVLNRGIFSFYYNKDTIIEMNKDEQNNITFNLSISLKIENNRYDKQVFNFENNSIELNAYDYLILDINVNNKQPNFVINTNNNRYFLGVSFDNVDFTLTKSESYNQNLTKENLNNGKIEFSYNNFSFTKNTFSNLFLIEYTYLTDALDYNNALEHEQVKSYFNDLTDQDLQNSIESGFLSNQELYMEFVKTADILFTSIGANENGGMLINKIMPSVTKILQYYNVLPQGEETYNLIQQLITNNEPVIIVISKNNKILTNLITSLISKDPFVVNLISSLLLKFDPNMSQEEKEKLKEEIKSLLKSFGVTNLNFINKIIDSLLDNGTLFDILKTVLKDNEFVTLIKNAVGVQFHGIIDLIVSIVSTDDINKPLLKIVVENIDKIISLLSGIIGNNPTIDALLKIIISSNKEFIEENLLALFNQTFKTLTTGILTNTTIQKNFKEFSYNKENQKVTYQYDYEYVFNKEVTIDLSTIKKLFPKEINLKSLGIDTEAIDNQVANTAVDIPLIGKVGLLTNNDVGNEWYIFKNDQSHSDINDILGQIPDSLTLGVNDKISFSYSNTNQKVWLNPTKNTNGDWFFGIQLPFIIKINLNASSMYKKIKTELENKILGEHNFNVWNEIASSIITILSKVYSASGMIKSTSENKPLTNFDYNDTLYMSDYNLTYNTNFDINTFNTISSYFNLESNYKNEELNIDSFFEKNNNDLEINKTLIQGYETLKLKNNDLIFSYNALNSSNIGTDTINGGSIQKGIKLRVPFRAKSLGSNIPTTLDLVIYLNVSNFSNNVYLPFNIKNGSTWSNHFTLSRTSLSVDGVADVYLPYKFLGKIRYFHYGKVKFPLFNTLL